MNIFYFCKAIDDDGEIMTLDVDIVVAGLFVLHVLDVDLHLKLETLLALFFKSVVESERHHWVLVCSIHLEGPDGDFIVLIQLFFIIEVQHLPLFD